MIHRAVKGLQPHPRDRAGRHPDLRLRPTQPDHRRNRRRRTSGGSRGCRCCRRRYRDYLDGVGRVQGWPAGPSPNRDPLMNTLVALIETLAGVVTSNGLAAIDALMTDGQRNALARMRGEGRDADYLERMFRGQRMHIAVAELLEAIAPGEWIYRHGGPGKGGRDYRHIPSGLEIELSTPAEYRKHMRWDGKDEEGDYENGPYRRCGFAIYNSMSST
jgi:hypothetical protein